MSPLLEILGVAAAMVGSGALAIRARLGAKRRAEAARRREDAWREEAMDLLAERRYQEAAARLALIVDARERDLGPFAPELSGWLYHLAVVQGMLAHDDDGEALLERALLLLRRDRRRAEGVTEGDLLLGLAMTALRRGRHDEAKRGLERARLHYESEAAAEPHAQALLEEGLGVIAEHHGDVDEAARRYRAALARIEAIGEGVSTPPLRSPYRISPAGLTTSRAPVYHARILERLGRLAYARRDVAEATQMYRRAIAIIEVSEGDAAPDLASILVALAATHLVAEQPREAERVARRGLAIAEAAMDVEVALDAREVLADARFAAGEADAEHAYEDLAARVASALGPDHPRLVRLLIHRGIDVDLRGRRDEGEALFARALQIAERAGDPRRRALAENALASSLAARGLLERAAAHAQNALFLATVREDEDTPLADAEAALFVDTLAEIRRREGRLADARRLSGRALAGIVSSLGAENHYTGIVRANVAKLLASEGRRAEAEAEHAAAHGIIVRMRGADSVEARRVTEEWEEAISHLGQPS